MTTLLVTYRLVVSPTYAQHTGFLAALKSGAGGCVRLSEGSYVIDTELSPTAVYEKLKRHVHQNDLLLVMRVSRPYFGQHSSDVVEWLNARL
jgi:hypothetical protein